MSLTQKSEEVPDALVGKTDRLPVRPDVSGVRSKIGTNIRRSLEPPYPPRVLPTVDETQREVSAQSMAGESTSFMDEREWMRQNVETWDYRHEFKKICTALYDRIVLEMGFQERGFPPPTLEIVDNLGGSSGVYAYDRHAIVIDSGVYQSMGAEERRAILRQISETPIGNVVMEDHWYVRNLQDTLRHELTHAFETCEAACISPEDRRKILVDVMLQEVGKGRSGTYLEYYDIPWMPALRPEVRPVMQAILKYYIENGSLPPGFREKLESVGVRVTEHVVTFLSDYAQAQKFRLDHGILVFTLPDHLQMRLPRIGTKDASARAKHARHIARKAFAWIESSVSARSGEAQKQVSRTENPENWLTYFGSAHEYSARRNFLVRLRDTYMERLQQADTSGDSAMIAKMNAALGELESTMRMDDLTRKAVALERQLRVSTDNENLHELAADGMCVEPSEVPLTQEVRDAYMDALQLIAVEMCLDPMYGGDMRILSLDRIWKLSRSRLQAQTIAMENQEKYARNFAVLQMLRSWALFEKTLSTYCISWNGTAPGVYAGFNQAFLEIYKYTPIQDVELRAYRDAIVRIMESARGDPKAALRDIRKTLNEFVYSEYPNVYGRAAGRRMQGKLPPELIQAITTSLYHLASDPDRVLGQTKQERRDAHAKRLLSVQSIRVYLHTSAGERLTPDQRDCMAGEILILPELPAYVHLAINPPHAEERKGMLANNIVSIDSVYDALKKMYREEYGYDVDGSHAMAMKGAELLADAGIIGSLNDPRVGVN